ncbi:MAG: hypothetical protein ACI828_000354 [Flavobacteriales bacterium]|jgi:hypothetical protein
MKHPYFNQYKFKYLEWNDADIIHEATLMWQSQLEFIEGEQLFLKELLSENTLLLLSETGFDMAKHLATDLSNLNSQLPKILEDVMIHRNDIVVLIDGTDEFQKEKAFQDVHLLLELLIGTYLEKYHILKEEIFKTMREVFKKSKKKQLLQP